MNITDISYRARSQVLTFNADGGYVGYRYKPCTFTSPWMHLNRVCNIKYDESFKFFKI